MEGEGISGKRRDEKLILLDCDFTTLLLSARYHISVIPSSTRSSRSRADRHLRTVPYGGLPCNLAHPIPPPPLLFGFSFHPEVIPVRLAGDFSLQNSQRFSAPSTGPVETGLSWFEYQIMGNEDFIELHALNDEVKDGVFNKENVKQAKGEIRNLDKQHTQRKYPEEDLVDKPPPLQGNVELVETVTIAEKMTGIESIVHGGNNDVILQKEVFSSHKIDGSCILFLP
ncbi:hypothetical protein CK203_034883 [Vitis vinifera]|uniref:Uncharacterized protein n=1 Tax=Vitis vinifera TaxID=29760 RepID=A0A438FYP8_VITVI|nr:hypothetical protein CK203_034883 [Vitis vinifera]